jgi:hypothetical protein
VWRVIGEVGWGWDGDERIGEVSIIHGFECVVKGGHSFVRGHRG